MVIKIPDYTDKQLLEILKRVELGVTYALIKKQYNITYYDIKRVCAIFKDCIFEEDCMKIKTRILEQNQKDLTRDHSANYQTYKDYYTDYNQLRQAERIAGRGDLTETIREKAQNTITEIKARINERKKERKVVRATLRLERLVALDRAIPRVPDQILVA